MGKLVSKRLVIFLTPFEDKKFEEMRKKSGLSENRSKFGGAFIRNQITQTPK